MRRGVHTCRSFLRKRSPALTRRYRNLASASHSTYFHQSFLKSCPCISIVDANHIGPTRLYSSASYRDPYKILNVSRSATPKEIRLAYFREAKKCHPDLHPGDPAAKLKFQELSAAYESIKSGNANDYGSGGYQTGYNARNAEETFRDVISDLDVFMELFDLIKDEKLSEFENFKAAFTAKDMEEMKAIGWRNRGFLLGIVLPAVAFLRFPVVIGPLLAASQVSLRFALAYFHPNDIHRFAGTVWRRVMAMAREKNARLKAEQRRRGRR